MSAMAQDALSVPGWFSGNAGPEFALEDPAGFDTNRPLRSHALLWLNNSHLPKGSFLVMEGPESA